MDCDYLLVCKSSVWPEVKESFPFHAPTPEKAVEHGKGIVAYKQQELEEKMPSASLFVKAVLYRGFHEFDGKDFITITHRSGL